MWDAWHRLERVIKWTGLSVNSFALNIGLKRSENLYQIKRGNNGISRDLAELIAAKYPSVSKGWLLTGEGTMFIDETLSQRESGRGIPYYGMDALAAVCSDVLPEPLFRINLPLFADGDLAALNIGTAMHPDIPAGAIVILKEWTLQNVVPGEIYLIVTSFFKGIRIIRQERESDRLVLLAGNSAQYDPIVLSRNEIVKLYIVQGIIIKKNL